jgi:hypothetical protein
MRGIPAFPLIGRLALAAGIGLTATAAPVQAGLLVTDPLGGAGMQSSDPVLRAQMPQPPSTGMVAALIAIGLGSPLLPARRRRPAPQPARLRTR